MHQDKAVFLSIKKILKISLIPIYKKNILFFLLNNI